MPNDYFDFQRFRVRQGRTAMKVTSEACLLGGWFAAKPLNASRILDIGTGTGLLMLMLAQRHGCPIDGIEIDPKAAGQCRENLEASPWADRLSLFEGDARTWDPGLPYDFILSNPPFYERSLPRRDPRMNAAMHGTSLTLDSLVAVFDRLASPTGRCGVILPVEKSAAFEERMSAIGFGTEERMTVRHSRRHPPMRIILCLSRVWRGAATEGDLYIDDPGGLLSDYYLGASSWP
jgi:tRNA1Val (adenine37-N6)-methyltransferase